MSEHLTAEQVAAYLKRLGINTPSPPLNELHLAHLYAVPFENLDIGLGRPIRLELQQIYRKVVEQRRGGYCYELNGLFAELLRSLVYSVELLSARVARPDGTFSAEFDHLALRVTDEHQAYLVDVGFGDAFLEPLPLQNGFTRPEGQKVVKLEQDGENWIYLEDRGAGFKPQYAFALTPYRMTDFEQMNVWQQTSPESHFTQNRICSRATPLGRLSLSGSKLICTENGARTEQTLGETEVMGVLAEQFGIELAATI